MASAAANAASVAGVNLNTQQPVAASPADSSVKKANAVGNNVLVGVQEETKQAAPAVLTAVVVKLGDNVRENVRNLVAAAKRAEKDFENTAQTPHDQKELERARLEPKTYVDSLHAEANKLEGNKNRLAKQADELNKKIASEEDKTAAQQAYEAAQERYTEANSKFEAAQKKHQEALAELKGLEVASPAQPSTPVQPKKGYDWKKITYIAVAIIGVIAAVATRDLRFLAVTAISVVGYALNAYRAYRASKPNPANIT